MSTAGNTSLPNAPAAWAERASAAGPSAADGPAERKLKEATGDFEAILLSSLWKSMKHSFAAADDSDASDPAKGTLDDWSIEVMSQAVGHAGGLGLGQLVLRQLEPALHREQHAPVAPALRGAGSKAGYGPGEEPGNKSL